jgi:hypothetical protein
MTDILVRHRIANRGGGGRYDLDGADNHPATAATAAAAQAGILAWYTGAAGGGIPDGGGEGVLPPGRRRITADTTLPYHSRKGLTIPPGGGFFVAAGATLTIECPIRAGAWRIFEGAGTVVLGRRAVRSLLPEWWGAVGDGAADDTLPLRAALAAAASIRGRVVLSPGATYVVTTAQVHPGTTLDGRGARLLRPPAQPNYTRTLYALYDAAADSAPITIRDLEIDGQSQAQGAYRGYEQQQSHLIYVQGGPVAGPVQAGRLRVRLRGVVLRGGVADGISLVNNVDAVVSDCEAHDCWRGGLVVTGGHTRVRATSLLTTGAVDRTGIDWEVDVAGYGGSMATETVLTGAQLDGDFDLTLREGSTWVGSGIVAGDGFYVDGYRSVVRISGSTFRVGAFADDAQRIVYPSDMEFTACTFVQAGVAAAGLVRGAPIHVFYNVAGSAEGGQRLRLVGCHLETAVAAPAGGLLAGILVEPDDRALGNRLEVIGGSIAAGFQRALHMAQGGCARFVGTRIESAIAFLWNGTAASPVTLEVESPSLGEGVTTYMYIVASNPANVLRQRGVVMREAQAAIGTTSGYGGTSVDGERVILADASPQGRGQPFNGLVSDRMRLRAPIAGAGYAWVATGFDGGGNTVWKEVERLAL